MTVIDIDLFVMHFVLHSFLDPTVYLLCRKICEYESYTGMKKRSERKFPCRVQSKIKTFLQFCYENWRIIKKKPTCFSHRIHKKVLDNLINAKNENVIVLIELLGS